MNRLIFHVDVNSAFLSWEAAKRVKEGFPDLRKLLFYQAAAGRLICIDELGKLL